MRDDRPSSTAAIVCAARAEIAAHPTIRDFSEPFAERLLPRWYSRNVGNSAQRGVARAFRGLSRSGAHIIALRMVAIDEGIRTAPELGQCVILGAGLDARAWRMPELREIDVYEVDHPATQIYKRRRARDFDDLPNHHYVSVDFERESLDDKLAEAGHDADVPTVWIWEGVTMYLNLEAIEGTLGVLEERSAPGSRLLVTYMPPSALRFLVGAGTAIFSEGLRAKFRPAELTVLLGRYGFDLVRDESSVDWHKRWALPGVRLLPGLASTERLATADKAKDNASF